MARPRRISFAGTTTPLLSAADPGVITSPDDLEARPNGHAPEHTEANVAPTKDDADSMPYTQVILLCWCAISEPTAYFVLFPFINEMIERTGNLDPTDVPFWGGLIESLFSVVQMVLMIFYGRMADRLGRKPVLVFSLTGITIATALFGLSQALWVMIVFRCLAGAFAGSIVTVRTMLGEITTKETQGRAFAWYMFSRNMGILLGPLIGTSKPHQCGGLANPATEFPNVFGGIAFFETYPYALATLAAGAIVLSATIVSAFFIHETLGQGNGGKKNSDPPMATFEVLRSPGVPMVLFVLAYISLLSLAYTAISPVFQYEDVYLGGFGFSDQQIAITLVVIGISQASWTILAFPWLQRTYGTGNVLRLCSAIWPFFMAGYPVLNEFLRNGWTRAFWVCLIVGLALGSSVSMSFAAIQLCVNDIAPSPAVLGTINALALTVSTGIRTFAPIAATSIYAASIKWGALDGQTCWILLIVLGIGMHVACWYIPEKAEGRPKAKAVANSDGDENID